MEIYQNLSEQDLVVRLTKKELSSLDQEFFADTIEDLDRVEMSFGEKDVFHISKKEDWKLQFIHATEWYLDGIADEGLKPEEIGTLVEFEQIVKTYWFEMTEEERKDLVNKIAKL